MSEFEFPKGMDTTSPRHWDCKCGYEADAPDVPTMLEQMKAHQCPEGE